MSNPLYTNKRRQKADKSCETEYKQPQISDNLCIPNNNCLHAGVLLSENSLYKNYGHLFV